MDSDKLLNLATSLGCLLAESGAEISRVEESVYRLLQAYQGKDAQVFAIPSCLIVSLMAEDGRPVTRMRRISAHGTDLELLESCNALCRQLCRTVPPLDEARPWWTASLPPAAATAPPRCCWATVSPPLSSVPCSAAGFGTA